MALGCNLLIPIAIGCYRFSWDPAVAIAIGNGFRLRPTQSVPPEGLNMFELFGSSSNWVTPVWTGVWTRVRTRVHAEFFFREGWGEGEFRFSSSSCLGGRATGGGQFEFEFSSSSRGVENASSNSQRFFSGGWGSFKFSASSSGAHYGPTYTYSYRFCLRSSCSYCYSYSIPEISWNHLFDGFLLQLPSPLQYRLYFIVDWSSLV